MLLYMVLQIAFRSKWVEEAFHLGLQMTKETDIQSSWQEQVETGGSRSRYWARVRLRIIVFAWKNYFGEHQKKEESKITVGGKIQ